MTHGATLHPVVAALLPARHRCSWPAPLAGCIAAVALVAAQMTPALAQQPLPPTPTTQGCPTAGQDLVRPPELVSSGGILSGTVILAEERQRIATSITAQNGTVTVTCDEQLVRIFRGQGLPPQPKAKPEANVPDPIPGPTLRARVGDLVQLRFVNEVNSFRFDQNIDLDKCMDVTDGINPVYPIKPKVVDDHHPNCLHASSTANIHFHGTHTNPNTTGDNVYLQVRPLPRSTQGNQPVTTTPDQAMVGFDEFFRNCSVKLKNPLNYWPVTWDDLPKSYVDKQKELLKAYQDKDPSQPLLNQDEQMIGEGTWPIYYIGAVPYCYALPAYTYTPPPGKPDWPPPRDSTSPNMGQAPGTHWYHAHKHGSTHINVLDGMSGAFIIEGKYDDDLNAFYGSYVMRDGRPWNTRAQPLLVLNTLATVPNLLSSSHRGQGPRGLDLSVNGRLRPKLQMQPGEVQLWRIVNSSARNAAYFMAPEGFEWRQIAQDGVQFNDQNYRSGLNKPFYMAPANRVDLLVKAPMTETQPGKPLEVWVQTVMGRSQVAPKPLLATETKPGTVLMSVEVKGPPIVQGGRPVQEMPFISPAPAQPPFLTDITDDEIKGDNFLQRKLTFNSGPVGSSHQHTINGIQFENGDAFIKIVMGAAEEWKIENTTVKQPIGPGPNGVIDHPLHIHINPFQVTEFFDPNENLTDPVTGQLLAVVVNGKTQPVPKYIPVGTVKTDPRQCFLDPDKPETWVPCQKVNATNLVWWDVFAIPSGRSDLTKLDGKPVVIPGYYKMRSRFVDYKGLYVLHCHILIHEDRGMMFSVQVIKPDAVFVRHH